MEYVPKQDRSYEEDEQADVSDSVPAGCEGLEMQIAFRKPIGIYGAWTRTAIHQGQLSEAIEETVLELRFVSL